MAGKGIPGGSFWNGKAQGLGLFSPPWCDTGLTDLTTPVPPRAVPHVGLPGGEEESDGPGNREDILASSIFWPSSDVDLVGSAEGWTVAEEGMGGSWVLLV